MAGSPNGGERSATSYKLTRERGEELRDFCRRQQKRRGFKGPLTSIQKIMDAALDAYMSTLKEIDAAADAEASLAARDDV